MSFKHFKNIEFGHHLFNIENWHENCQAVRDGIHQERRAADSRCRREAPCKFNQTIRVQLRQLEQLLRGPGYKTDLLPIGRRG